MYSIATANSAVELEVVVKELVDARSQPVWVLAVEPYSYIKELTTQYNQPKFHQALMSPLA